MERKVPLEREKKKQRKLKNARKKKCDGPLTDF